MPRHKFFASSGEDWRNTVWIILVETWRAKAPRFHASISLAPESVRNHHLRLFSALGPR